MEETTKKKDTKFDFFKLFSGYFWLGVVFILGTIILDLLFNIRPFWASVVISLGNSIGIAIVVASIFTYASGTSEFINKIQSLLQDIVVSRNFLGNIDPESKREALNALIKPSSEEKRVYSNIEDYLNTYISQTMDITSKCIRSNYTVYARAYVDKIDKQECVCVKSDISYRLYPTKDGYSDIKVGFLVEDKLSRCERIIINTPHGDREVINSEKIEFNEVEVDAGKIRVASIDLSKHAKKCSHLDISVEFFEVGSDHWLMLSFCALMPTDGFKHTLDCADGLKINSFHTFIHGAKFYVDKKSDAEMRISCNEWINEGTGISILISKAHN